MTLTRLSGPVLEPISLAEAKSHLRIDTSDEDSIILALISAARLHVERVTRKITIHQNWRLYVDDLPTTKTVLLPISPISQISAVTFYDAQGNPSVLDAASYIVDLTSYPARLKFNGSVPFTSLREFNGIEIDLVAGYGATTIDVPSDLKQAILLLVAHWFENRSAVTDVASYAPIPSGVQELLQPFRTVSL